MTTFDLNPLASNGLAQFLVNRKTQQAYAMADGDSVGAAKIDKWFDIFLDHIRRICGDTQMTMDFSRTEYTFKLTRRDGYSFDIREFSDGHRAALVILTELLLRTEVARDAKKDETFEPWRKAIRELARRPNMAIKIGGLSSPLSICPSLPPSSAALAPLWKPYVETCIAAFGADRALC